MALKSELMGVGIPAQVANRIGFDALTAFAAAGNSQATATPLTSNCANITSGSGGVIISPDQMYLIANNSGGAVNVYPFVGGTVNGGTLNAAFSLTNGKTLIVFPAGLNVIANMSA